LIDQTPDRGLSTFIAPNVIADGPTVPAQQKADRRPVLLAPSAVRSIHEDRMKSIGIILALLFSAGGIRAGGLEDWQEAARAAEAEGTRWLHPSRLSQW
jgi:hypothetical protein